MCIMWKVIVRETCFSKKILSESTISWVFQKYFNFVPMLESRNVHHVKSNCSWDMFLWKILAESTVSWVFIIQKSCCLNIYLVGRLLLFALIGQHLDFVFFCTFLNWRCQAKCLTFEISDFTPCANAQNIIVHIAEKSDD